MSTHRQSSNGGLLNYYSYCLSVCCVCVLLFHLSIYLCAYCHIFYLCHLTYYDYCYYYSQDFITYSYSLFLTSTSTSTENDKTALIPYPCDFQFGSKTSTTTFNTSLTNKSDSLLSATGLASTTATTTGSTLQLVVGWSNDVLGTYEFM